MQPPRTDAQRVLGGRYRVLDRLGSGGMASVLLAEDERLGRQVAIKRLPTSSPDDALARFRREARIGAALNHPNFVSIFDSAVDDDALLIVMEYVRGESLKERLARGPLDPGEAIAILGQVAAALDHAHAAGVIHRDVKPSNVLIAGDGTAKLADLGIATATDATSITTANDIIGTLSYIAPERLEGAADDPSSDVYSLAAVAFEVLSGEKAQRAETAPQIVAAGEPPDLLEVWPEAPPAAAAVLREGMARGPGRRPRSAGELIGRLSAAIGGEPYPAGADSDATETLPIIAAAVPAAMSTPEPQPRRSRRGLAIGALLAGAAGVAVAIALIASDGDSGKPVANVKTRTQTVTTRSQAQTQPAPPSGDVLGAQLNDRGFALIQQGDPAAAIPILQRAVAAFADGTTDINYAYALYNLGHALRLAGQPEAAVPILEQRLKIGDQTGVVAADLALAQQQADEKTTGGTGPPANEGDQGDGGSSGAAGPGGSASGGVGPG